MKLFLNYINNVIPLSIDAQNALTGKLKKETFNKHHILIKELAQCENLFFIEKGLVRAYYFREGRDITDWFGLENSVIGPIIRRFPTKSGSHTVEVLEDVTVIYISFNDLQELYDEFHEIERLGRLIAINTIITLQAKIDSIQFLTAQQRYQDFITAYPTILKRFPLGQIASYLGMNQVTLSRVRKNIG